MAPPRPPRPVSGEFPIARQTPGRNSPCCDTSRIRIRIRLHSDHGAHDGVRAVETDARFGGCTGTSVEHASRRHRRLIQPATVRLPSIRTDTRACTARVSARVRRAPVQPRVRSMTVIVTSEIEELPLQISGRPEEGAVQTFPPNSANQSFNEWMRERHVRRGLDLFHVKDPQIRLPLVESVQWIVVRTEAGRRRLATDRSIEHLTQPDAIDDAALYAKKLLKNAS